MTSLSQEAVFWADDASTRDTLTHSEVVAAHLHDFGQLAYAATGALVTVTEVGTWMAPANRVTWVPPYFVHSRRSYGKSDASVLCVPASLCAQLPPQPSVFVATPLLREAYVALQAESERAPGPRVALLFEVIAEELSSARDETLRLPEPSDDRLKAVTDILHADPANPATLADLGHSTGVSDRTLSRLFGSELGMTFHQWRTLLRIQCALIDLGAGHAVTDISARLGWSNPTSFIAAFTSLVGQTPGRYQQEIIHADALG